MALGPAKDIHERTVQRPGHNPWLWVAFTPSRYVEVPFATGNPSSYLLCDVERLEVKRGMLGGRKLVVKTSEAPDNLALEVLDVPRSAFAAAIKPLVDMRREAPSLPDEYTRYERVNVSVVGDGMAAVVAVQTVELRCVLCRGSCGIETPVGSLASEAGAHVYERCTGCLRRVEADSDASAT